MCVCVSYYAVCGLVAKVVYVLGSVMCLIKITTVLYAFKKTNLVVKIQLFVCGAAGNKFFFFKFQQYHFLIVQYHNIIRIPYLKVIIFIGQKHRYQ